MKNSGVDENFPLLYLNGDQWRVSDSLEGTHVFGGTGSGKTTGSGQTIALNMLAAGMGGLVLTVKPDEVDLWRRYCKHTKRELVIFGPRVTKETPHTFNFLEYERRRVTNMIHKRYPEEKPEALEGIVSSFLTENLVNLFSAIMEVAQRGTGGGGKNDAYWQGAVRQLLRNAIDLLILSRQKLTFQNIYGLITSAPSTEAHADLLRDNREIAAEAGGIFGVVYVALLDLPPSHPRRVDAELLVQFWFDEYPVLSPETRSIILSTFTSMADPFLRGTLRQLFSPDHETEQLDPDLVREGKILLINLPVKEYFEMGQFAQVLYKFIFQRAMERGAESDEAVRPVFLWADEAQFFLNNHDMLFQTTARSSKVATVYLTQNISSYYALMPGEQGKAQTDSLLGNFVTKIFHANTDSVTNTWASELIAKTTIFRRQVASNETFNPATLQPGKVATLGGILFGNRTRGTHGYNVTQSQVVDYQVPPVEFTKLSSGGKRNNLVVKGIFVQGGRVTAEGKNFQLLVFEQNRV